VSLCWTFILCDVYDYDWVVVDGDGGVVKRM
jgi:hypothetical protein